MSLKIATLIALIGAAISVILRVLLVFQGPELYQSFLFSGISGQIINLIPSVAYLIFFVMLFVKQK